MNCTTGAEQLKDIKDLPAEFVKDPLNYSNFVVSQAFKELLDFFEKIYLMKLALCDSRKEVFFDRQGEILEFIIEFLPFNLDNLNNKKVQLFLKQFLRISQKHIKRILTTTPKTIDNVFRISISLKISNTKTFLVNVSLLRIMFNKDIEPLLPFYGTEKITELCNFNFQTSLAKDVFAIIENLKNKGNISLIDRLKVLKENCFVKFDDFTVENFNVNREPLLILYQKVQFARSFCYGLIAFLLHIVNEGIVNELKKLEDRLNKTLHQNKTLLDLLDELEEDHFEIALSEL